MACDLHTHSNHSDGTLSPRELAAEAGRLGLIIALTDHNTVSGLPDFLAEAERLGVTAVPGVELSTDWEGTELHLLGLFLPPEQFPALEALTGRYHLLKEESNRALVDRLRAAGYEIDYASVKARNATGSVNRAHVAAELLERGYVTSVKEAFRTLLREGGGFYVPPERLPLTDAIAALRSMGALPVLAHPLQELTEQQLRTLLPTAIQAGLLGLECRHSSYDEAKTALAASLAAEFGLLPSGGSDFHGFVKPDVALGSGRNGNAAVPDSVYEGLKQLSDREKG